MFSYISVNTLSCFQTRHAVFKAGSTLPGDSHRGQGTAETLEQVLSCIHSLGAPQPSRKHITFSCLSTQ